MRWLLDEMLPPKAAVLLAELGHDAVSVRSLEMTGDTDSEVMERAVRERRVVVTENFADFVALLEARLRREQPCVPVLFIRKAAFPARGALATHLARGLHDWSLANPEPYPGPHWA